MGAIIIKQPNGLYMRFSTTVDCPTHYNMTKEDYIQNRIEWAKEDAKETIENYTRNHSCARDNFMLTNMTQEKFDNIMHEIFMDNPVKTNIKT